jgi:hypothetical protein
LTGSEPLKALLLPFAATTFTAFTEPSPFTVAMTVDVPVAANAAAGRISVAATGRHSTASRVSPRLS